MWRTFSTPGGCFPLHGNPGRQWLDDRQNDIDVERSTEPLAPGWVAVPDLTGMSAHDARRGARLAELRLSVEEQPTASGLRGRVIRQDPAAGALVRPGDVVDAWIGTRPGVVVPDVRGSEEQDALASLRAAGLYPSRRVVRRSDSIGQDLVVRTRPRAGSAVPAGTRVTYVVAAARRARASARREARRSRVRQMLEGPLLSMPFDE